MESSEVSRQRNLKNPVEARFSMGMEERPSGPIEVTPHTLLPPRKPADVCHGLRIKGVGLSPTFDYLDFLRRVPTMRFGGRLFYQCTNCLRHYPGLAALLRHSAHCVTADSAHSVTADSAYCVTADSAHCVTADSAHCVTADSAHCEPVDSAHCVTADSAHCVTADSAHGPFYRGCGKSRGERCRWTQCDACSDIS